MSSVDQGWNFNFYNSDSIRNIISYDSYEVGESTGDHELDNHISDNETEKTNEAVLIRKNQLNVNYAPINTNNQTFINVNTKIRGKINSMVMTHY